MGTKNSSMETRKRAKLIASQIGSYHFDSTIDEIVSEMTNTFSKITGIKPKFVIDQGTIEEDLALQNVQARLRMILS